MKKLHMVISTGSINASVKDYSERLGVPPCVLVHGEYALWRTATLNISIRQDSGCSQGMLRHLGWEDDNATAFTKQVDVNGITWERFSARQLAEEMNALWPEANYKPE
jgi:hypothetical protein